MVLYYSYFKMYFKGTTFELPIRSNLYLLSSHSKTKHKAITFFFTIHLAAFKQVTLE